MRIVLSVLTVLAAAGSSSTWQDRLPLEIDVPGEVSRYQPVMLWYSIRNDSTASQAINLGFNRIGSFTFVLERPDGSVQKSTPDYPPRDWGGRSPVLTLAPGESYRLYIVLNEWLRFDQVGEYSLRIELTGQAASALSIIGDDTRQVWIRPVNPAQIEARCKALLGSLVPMTRFDTDFGAAVAELAWTRHPAAIPYLEKAIAAEVRPILFDALVAIGTAEARNAVVRLTRHPTPWVANGARNALSRFGGGKSTAPAQGAGGTGRSEAERWRVEGDPVLAR